MIDIILFTFSLGLFFAGFKCGSKFGTVRGMLAKAKTSVKDWINKPA